MEAICTVSDLMVTSVPIVQSDKTVRSILEWLRENIIEDISYFYLTDKDSVLIGQAPIEKILHALPETILRELLGDPPLEVHSEDNAISVALLAVEQHNADVAVVDAKRRIVGAIPIKRLLKLLHDEHVEDIFRNAGIGMVHPLPNDVIDIFRSFVARIPWLLLGLLGGMLAGGMASLFEESFKREVTFAYFLPLIVYMADAIGTQTETVLIRRMAYGPVSLFSYLRSEYLLGLLLGVTLGGGAWLGLIIWSDNIIVANVVGLTIFATAIIAIMVASILPWSLNKYGIDPALASGPIATVFQDLLSVFAYLAIATLIT